jgi:hypothetical protein
MRLWVENPIRSELTSFHDKIAFRMASLPLGRRAIGNKWVFKLKSNPDGSVNRFKARLVAQCPSQRPGVDYSYTFSSIVKLITLRTVLALIAARGMHTHSADIETALFHADLQVEIFMLQSKGVEDGTARALRLFKRTMALSKLLVSGIHSPTSPIPPSATSVPHPTPAFTL